MKIIQQNLDQQHFLKISWLVLAVLLCLVPRAVDMISDPPPDLSTSGGYWADEGFWTHNARNKILFGKWITDEWNNMYASPVPHFLTYAVFKMAGIGLRQARVVPVLLIPVRY